MTVSEAGWFTAGFYPEGFASKFASLCGEFELEMDQKIKTLSKGGRAKVSLALSMAHEPELLVMDEPTSGLDTLVRRKFLESMVDVAAMGKTVLLSSHQIPEVERVADYVAIIHQGRVLISDRLENLKRQIERWVISFSGNELGLPQFDGQIITHNGKDRKRQQMIIRDPAPDALWQLRDHPGVADVEVHTPSLEEIFVAYLKSNLSRQSPGQIAASPPAKAKQLDGGSNS
jgi:ABC-2 type transport system ATP-binding protein